MATPAVTDVIVYPTGQKWYPSFSSKVDPTVVDAIIRLYDMMYQQSDQIQILAQYAKNHP
jgi:hypothetical protein